MPQEYDGEELMVYWTLLPAEEVLVSSKRGPARLGFAVLLKLAFPVHRRNFVRWRAPRPEARARPARRCSSLCDVT